MTTDVRSPMKWVGGKFVSAERIVKAFPASHLYDRYCEPCCGAAHVFFARSFPTSHHEVLSDLNGDVVNFWTMLRDHAEEMQERLESLPYARSVYYLYYRSLFDGSQIDPLERAVRWYYVLRSTPTGWIRRSPVGWGNLVENAKAFHSLLPTFAQVRQRLQNVLLDNRDVLSLLKKYQGTDTLFYVDPPYIGAEHYYETPPFDHAALAAVLNEVQGFVALSYYPHPHLDEWYPASKWRRITWQQHKPSAIGADEHTGDEFMATETLLCNYPEAAPAPSLWD